MRSCYFQLGLHSDTGVRTGAVKLISSSSMIIQRMDRPGRIETGLEWDSDLWTVFSIEVPHIGRPLT